MDDIVKINAKIKALEDHIEAGKTFERLGYDTGMLQAINYKMLEDLYAERDSILNSTKAVK